jgi:glutamyl-tRNA synthetase
VCENLQKDCGDFIVRRSDGVFAYQLAVAADDGDAGVSEVVRGQDLLGSTARQIWLMRRLGYTAPRYCHTPLLLAPDGRRLSKRDRDLDLGALRARLGGPEPLVGLLAHLAGLLPKPKAVRAGDLVSRFSWAVVHRQNITLEPDFLRDFF